MFLLLTRYHYWSDNITVYVYIYSNHQKRENTLEQCFQDLSSTILLPIFSRTVQVSRCLYDLGLHLVLQGWPWPQHAVDCCIIRHGGHQRNLGTAGSHLAPRPTPRFFGHVLKIFSAWNTIKNPTICWDILSMPLFFWGGHDKPIWDLLRCQLSGRHRFFPASGRRSSSISAINGERSCQDDNYGFESILSLNMS